jgi:hypothetical protein
MGANRGWNWSADYSSAGSETIRYQWIAARCPWIQRIEETGIGLAFDTLKYTECR